MDAVSMERIAGRRARTGETTCSTGRISSAVAEPPGSCTATSIAIAPAPARGSLRDHESVVNRRIGLASLASGIGVSLVATIFALALAVSALGANTKPNTSVSATITNPTLPDNVAPGCSPGTVAAGICHGKTVDPRDCPGQTQLNCILSAAAGALRIKMSGGHSENWTSTIQCRELAGVFRFNCTYIGGKARVTFAPSYPWKPTVRVL